MCHTELLVPSLGDESLLYEAVSLRVLRIEIPDQRWNHKTSDSEAQRPASSGMEQTFVNYVQKQ